MTSRSGRERIGRSPVSDNTCSFYFSNIIFSIDFERKFAVTRWRTEHGHAAISHKACKSER